MLPTTVGENRPVVIALSSTELRALGPGFGTCRVCLFTSCGGPAAPNAELGPACAMVFPGYSGAEKRCMLEFRAPEGAISLLDGGDRGALVGVLNDAVEGAALFGCSISPFIECVAVADPCEYTMLPFPETSECLSFVTTFDNADVGPGLLLPFSKLPRIVPFIETLLWFRTGLFSTQLPLERPFGTEFRPGSAYMPQLDPEASPPREFSFSESVGVRGGVVS